MTNVSPLSLVKLGRTALNIRNYGKCFPCEVPPIGCLESLVASAIVSHSTRILCNHQSRRYMSSEDGADTNDKSSFSHQQYHRRRYEHKRSNQKQNQRTNHERQAGGGAGERMNHYQRLNIEPTSDIATIKSAYYALSKEYHPDVAGNDNAAATDNFRMISESYSVLSDPKSRASYDKELNLTRDQVVDMYSYQPSAHPNRNHNPIYRTRRADSIFRGREEAALELEKMRNPQKFKAGSFKREQNYSSVESIDRAIDNLEIQLSRFGDRGSFGSKDGSDFYRMHMFDTMERRRGDLLNYKSYRGHSSSPSKFDGQAALALIGAFFLGIYLVVKTFSDFDLADRLDRYYESKLKAKKEEEERLKNYAIEVAR